MITVQIARIEQCMDLKKKSFENVVKLELPSGVVIDAVVSEAAVAQIMQAVAAEEPESAQPGTRPAVAGTVAVDSSVDLGEQQSDGDFAEGEYDGVAAQIFGGIPEQPVEPSMPAPAVPKPLPLTPPQPSRIRTVPKTEYGYPIVSGGVGMSSIMAEPPDDSGVPQI